LAIKKYFRSLRATSQSEFIRNASKLMTGSVLSQVLTVFTAPVLSRIYLPADYGLLGLYGSVTGLIAMFGTFQYANAIVIAKNDDEVRGLMKLCLQILGIITIATLVAMLLFGGMIGNLLEADHLPTLLLLAPLSVSMSGLSGIFGNYAVRKKQFTLVSQNRVVSAVLAATASIGIGYFWQNPIGLFVGLWIGQVTSGFFLAFKSLKQSGESWVNLWSSNTNTKTAQTYVNFPKYSLPADFINNFTNQIPVFMLNAYGTPAAVGSFNMSNRLLGLPIGFISSAVGEVFRQRAAQDYIETNTCRPIFIKTFKTLGLLSILPFAIIIVFGPQLFSFVLGDKWHEAGVYAQIMGIMFFFRFTVSPLTYVYYIANKQKEDFILHFMFLLVAYFSFYLGYQLFHSTYYSLLLFSIFYSLIYCVYLVRSYQISKG